MAWQVDYAHSHVYFSVKHMMIAKVRGEFRSFKGTFDFNEENPINSTFEVSIDAASILTHDEQRDGHLRSPDFLNADNYPSLTFKSKRVEKDDKNHGHLVGDLTIQDVTNEVVLDVLYAGQAQSPSGSISAGFSATTTISRKAWNLTWNQALETGGWLVGDNVNIEIELELVKVSEEEPVSE
jgi:polyisoprenoid-binding protein YceI